VFCRELSIYVWHRRWKKYSKYHILVFSFGFLTQILLQFRGSLSDNEVLCLMTMYFVKIQRILDTLNPYKSPIWLKTESVEGYFLICKNFNPAVRQLTVSAAKLQTVD